MRTVKIIHSTPAAEAAGIGALVVFGIVGGILFGLYTLLHWAFAETKVPMDRIAISWSEPDRAEMDSDAFYGGGVAGPTTTRSAYKLAFDLRNNSDSRLYAVGYELTLHVCDTIRAAAETCPIVETTNGEIYPDLVPGGHGLQNAAATFLKAENYIGYGRLTLRWTGARGVAP